MEDIISKAQSLTEKYAVSPKITEGRQIQVTSKNTSGFSFSLVVNGSEYVLVFGDWHQPFDKQEEALSAFEKCLSGKAQLKVTTCFNIPCQGALEILDTVAQRLQAQYVMSSLLGLLLFPFPKKEKIYRNLFIRSS